MEILSIRFLCILWFSLCGSLVWKYNELVYVFFAFAGSFSSAIVFASFEANSTFNIVHHYVGSGPTIIQQLNSYGANINTKIKVKVGLLASLLSLSIQVISRFFCDGNETELFISGSILVKQEKYPLEFYGFCIMAGYLAFDLWFDNLYCRGFPLQVLQTMEDALTLSILSVLLTHWNDLVMPQTPLHITYISSSSLDLWLSYKVLRLWFHFRSSRTNQVENTPIRNIEVESSTRKINDVRTHENVKVAWLNHASNNDDNVGKLNHWTIHGIEYDLVDFVSKHPGGKESILLGRGRDCTALFESYHPFTTKHRVVLQKFRAPPSKKLSITRSISSNSTLTTPNKTSVDSSQGHIQDIFYDSLKERVYQKLKDAGIDPIQDRCATFSRSIYYGFIVALLFVSGYYHVLKANPIGSVLFALFGWLLGALGHDAGHFSFSRNAFLNDVGVWAMSFLCNPIMWQHQHTYAHHSHTNDFDLDPDLHHFEIMLRVHQRFSQKSVYKHQKHALYVAAAYALVVFGECIKIPLSMMQTGSLYGIVDFTDKNRKFRAFGMYFHYTTYLILIVISPIYFSTSWLIGFLCVVVHITSIGWLFAVFSQINHLNEKSLRVISKEKKLQIKSDEGTDASLKRSWAVKQVQTSNNFASQSLFWYLFSNGLNYQIEHHLFPGLNHCHLYLIAPTVKKTCEEFGIEYKTYDSWSDIMNATLNWLKKLSAVNQNEYHEE